MPTAPAERTQRILAEHPKVAPKQAVTSEEFEACVVWTADYTRAGYQPAGVCHSVAPRGLEKGISVSMIRCRVDWTTFQVEAPSADATWGEVFTP